MRILALVPLVRGVASTAFAQGTPIAAAPTLPADAVALETSLLLVAQPAVRTWVASQGTAAFRSTSDLASIDRSVRAALISATLRKASKVQTSLIQNLK